MKLVKDKEEFEHGDESIVIINNSPIDSEIIKKIIIYN